MKIIYVTDLHGDKWKYEQLYKLALFFKPDVVINGGDLLPADRKIAEQELFISEYLSEYFSKYDKAGIYYLCCLGNDDRRIFDRLFEKICRKFIQIKIS